MISVIIPHQPILSHLSPFAEADPHGHPPGRGPAAAVAGGLGPRLGAGHEATTQGATRGGAV